MRPARAFTLIELLVVICVIGVLAGMLIVIIGPVMEAAKSAVTIQRINDALMGLSQKGQQEGMTAFALQQECSKGYADVVDNTVSGVFTYMPEPAANDPSGIAQKINNDPLNGGFPTTVSNYLDSTGPQKYQFAYPWGKKHVVYTRVKGAQDADKNDTYFVVSSAQTYLDKHDLRDINPLKTRELLRAAGTIPRDSLFKDYMSDRSPKQNWNDRWGNPLVAAFAFYQAASDTVFPTPYALSAGSNDRGRRDALQLYQYERRFYVSIGAAGRMLGPTAPDVLSTPSGTPPTDADLKANDNTKWIDPATGNLVLLWKQVTDLCEYDHPFNELSFDNPPWTGVKRAKLKQGGKQFLSFLSTPLEF